MTPRCTRPGRLGGGPLPGPPHNKGLPEPGRTLPPAALLQRGPATFPASPPRPPPQTARASPASTRPPRAAEHVVGRPLPPSSPRTAEPAPPRAGRRLPRPSAAPRFPGGAEPLPPVPPTHGSGALRPPAEPSANPSPHPGCPTRPNPQEPTRGPSCPASPHPQPGSRFPARPGLPPLLGVRDSRDPPEPLPGHQPPAPSPGALGPHTPNTSSPHPHTHISIPSPRGVVLPHTQALVPAGVSRSRTSFPALPGVSPPTGVPLPYSWVLPQMNLDPRTQASARAPQLPPAPTAGSAPVVRGQRVPGPGSSRPPQTVPRPPTRPPTPHLSPSAEDGGAGARSEPRPQIQRLSPKPTAASAGLL